MNKLEKIISENREFFNSEEPADGHFRRFEEKLNKQNRRNRIMSAPFLLKAASIAVLVVLSSLWAYQTLFTDSGAQNNLQAGTGLRDISPEYAEVEVYFTSQLNEKYTELNQIDFSDSLERKLMMNELLEMDSIYNTLKQELSANPNDERIINSMIRHYEIKLEIMNKIINQLRNIKSTKKTNNYESTEI